MEITAALYCTCSFFLAPTRAGSPLLLPAWKISSTVSDKKLFALSRLYCCRAKILSFSYFFCLLCYIAYSNTTTQWGLANYCLFLIIEQVTWLQVPKMTYLPTFQIQAFVGFSAHCVFCYRPLLDHRTPPPPPPLRLGQSCAKKAKDERTNGHGNWKRPEQQPLFPRSMTFNYSSNKSKSKCLGNTNYTFHGMKNFGNVLRTWPLTTDLI